MVEESEEGLLLASEVSVEGPCKNALRSHHEPQVGVHAATARCAIPASSARSELVEPDRSREISLRHQCLKCATYRFARIEAFRSERHVGLIGAQIIEAPPGRGIPEI